MNTKDIKIGEKFFGLFIGAPGTGKSIAAHSIHYLGPTFTFDYDRKMDAVASRFPKAEFNYEQFDSVVDALKVLSALRSNCPYKSIIWDGWHTFAALCLKTSMALRAPGKKRITTGNIERYQIEDYGVEGRAIEQATDDLQYLYSEKNVNIVTIAHWRRVEVYNIKTNTSEVVEGLFIPGGKMAFAVPTPYNELYWFSKEVDMSTGKTVVTCETNGSHDTKTVLKVDDKFSFTREENFFQKLFDMHERNSKVISL